MRLWLHVISQMGTNFSKEPDCSNLSINIVFCLEDVSNFLETLVAINQTTWRHIPEDQKCDADHHKNSQLNIFIHIILRPRKKVPWIVGWLPPLWLRPYSPSTKIICFQLSLTITWPPAGKGIKPDICPTNPLNFRKKSKCEENNETSQIEVQKYLEHSLWRLFQHRDPQFWGHQRDVLKSL
jgi:hypothetical protein